MGIETPPQKEPQREPRDIFIERGATELLVAVWRAIQAGRIDAREPMADAALTLRDLLNPDWPSNADWLPEPLASEREARNSQELAD
jgi:hypothetical protein